MSWSGSSIITEFSLPGLPSAGIQIDGYLRVLRGVIYPYPSGPVIQAAGGTYWKLGITVVDGEGILTTTQVFI